MLSLNYWEKAAAFHGHTCPGLAIGFKAVEGAIAELGLDDTQLPAIDARLYIWQGESQSAFARQDGVHLLRA